MNQFIKLIVAFFFILTINAQEEYPHLLVFKDGTEIRGKVVVWDNYKIVFRKADTDEKESYKYKLLRSVNDVETGKEYEGLYVLRQLKGSDRTLRLKKAISGKIECFYIPRESSAYGGFGSDATTVTSLYFISRLGEDEVIQIRSGLRSKKNKRKLKEYLSDCPELISKIDEGYFNNQIESLEQIIRYYNTKC
ncbi:hypothetical protein [Aquimarina sp. SS2-1]|uniref:hypothetical protein n=1 Tax=Aquimarina besae TaxID=3342247 RepID=UPI00366E5042